MSVRLLHTGSVYILLVMLLGCASDVSSPVACNDVLRFQGTVYSAMGSTDRAGSEFGKATRAVCDDTSDEGGGLTFPPDAETISIVSFKGMDTAEVIGARSTDGLLYFYIAEDEVSSERLEAISEEMSSAKSG